jgi:hypothetical protein
MKTQDEIKRYIQTHPGMNDRRIRDNMRRHGVTTAEVTAARAALHGTKSDQALPAAAGGTKGKSIRNLLEQFDDVGKVQKAMKALPRDQYFEDDEIRRQLGIAIGRWRDVRGHPALATYLFKLPNQRFVWMHPSAQQSLSAAINLSQQ